MRIALLCEEAAGLRTLQLLARSPHEIVAVLTSSGSATWNWAQKLGLAPLPAGRVREADFAEALARLRVELLLNVHSLYIVPKAVLRVPAHGAYNLHPGALPEYAGLNAPSWAIYHGEAFHGVTLHRMEPGIDTGPIAFQTRFRLDDERAARARVRARLRLPAVRLAVGDAAGEPWRSERTGAQDRSHRYAVRRRARHPEF